MCRPQQSAVKPAVPNRVKSAPTLDLVRSVADAKRYLWRESFAPDATIDPKLLIADLLVLLNARLTPDEKAAIEHRLNGARATVSLGV